MGWTWSVVAGLCVLAGCAPEDAGSPLTESGTPSLPPSEAPGSLLAPEEEPDSQSLSSCSGAEGTAKLAWSYVPREERALEFTGTMDAEGNLYATECPRFWDVSEDGPLEQRICEVLSFTRDGATRYRRTLSGTEYVHVDLISGGRLYGTFDRATPRVSALSAVDGSVLWTAPLSPLLAAGCSWAWVSAPVLAQSNLVVAVHAYGTSATCNALIALDAATGEVSWQVNTPQRLSQPIADAQGHLYTSTFDWGREQTDVLSYTADGTPRWKATRAGHREPLAVNGGTLLLSSEELADADTGAFRAVLAVVGIPHYRSEGELPFGPYPHGNVALGGKDLLALADGRCTGPSCPTEPHVSGQFFYGVDATDGALRWTLPVGGSPSAPLLTARGTLLLVDRPVPEDCEFGCQGEDSYFDSYLHEFSQEGQELAACKLQGQAPFVTPPALHQGRLFLGARLNWDAGNDSTVFLGLQAYELAAPTGPALSGWVTEGGGNGREGQPR
ncbi:PQQ-binding-like beta-propeller repeat protein [Stigmatella sp. ncwal1]|uniref:PQQ-binding-like beta-propeller repeat protein n=1 Tax=Stigmatella ashevillensis TaxID=2995309 RepID=A0ABT5DJY0_9BACT|nr:PQQ-binding-like beta-propeller repeat protein [Stigmatella ashevillena]MDC0713966.1 PQQ-binding-like beta-propeller repeat protein [Stigmatella ashevillena]